MTSSPRSSKRALSGWVLLDKPKNMGSTTAVSIVKRLFKAKKAGHAGTLDPLATGMLPIALGEATKLIPFVQEGEKTYQFTIRFGTETPSDDCETSPIECSEKRPTKHDLLEVFSQFEGDILQIPPAFSAIKLNGERAYDLAREAMLLASASSCDLKPRKLSLEQAMVPRRVFVRTLKILAPEKLTDPLDEVTCEVVCGKGTYIRSFARDVGRALGCLGHITALRRTRVGVFFEHEMIFLENLKKLSNKEVSPLSEAGDSSMLAEWGEPSLETYLKPLHHALDDILAVGASEARDLQHGRFVRFLEAQHTRDDLCGVKLALWGEVPIALVVCEQGGLKPIRVFGTIAPL